ncbi:MAG: hypothetical protein GX465_18415, partial [Acidobacteria bacterium]|nr:hypothetical protein [Acidobacteriota bacterium]
TATVTVYALPSISGTLTVCDNSTTQLTGSGTPAASNPWVSSNTAVATVSNTGLVTGQSAGTSVITYTNNNGCSTAATVTVTAPPTTANAGPDQTGASMCGLTTTTLAANTPSTGTGSWSIISGAGGNIATASSPTSTFSGVAGTSYTLRWTISNPPCTSSTDDVIITFQQNPAAPTVNSITQPSCTDPTGSVLLTGLPSAGWTLTRSPGGNIYTGSGTSTTITNLTQSTSYTFTVTNLSGCTSVPSASVVINTQPSTPTAPTVGTITQPTCTNSTGSVSLGGLPAGSWTITRTPGNVNTLGSGGTTIIANLPADETYTFTVTNSSGCTSPSSGSVVINAQPLTPSAPVIGTITQPTCTVATGSVALSGLPASGTWTLTRFPDGTTFTGTGTTRTITGLIAGTTFFFTVANSDGCTSLNSASVPVKTQPVTPSIPVIGAITQPSCTSATGSVVLNGLPGTGTWTLTRTPGGTTNGSGTSYTVTGLSAGSYTFTVTNADGCTSGSTLPVDIEPQPDVPTTPVVGSITDPTCSSATGSVVMTGLPASGTWTLTRTPGNVTTSGTGTSTTVSGLPAGSYTFTVTNSLGCKSASSGTVVIDAQPPSPPDPTQTIDCSQGFGKAVITVTNPTGAGYTYSLDGGSFQASVTFTNVANGTHNITVRNSYGCLTTGPNFSVNCGCSNPPTVTLSATEGSTCGTTSITVSG